MSRSHVERAAGLWSEKGLVCSFLVALVPFSEYLQRRLYLEAKDRERKTREELDFRLETAEFEEWAATLATEEKTRLVPPTDFAKPGSPGHNVQLKQYFREKIWPGMREKVIPK